MRTKTLLAAYSLLFLSLPLAGLALFHTVPLAGRTLPSHWGGKGVDAVAPAEQFLAVSTVVAVLVTVAFVAYALVFRYGRGFAAVFYCCLVVSSYCLLTFAVSYATSQGGLHPYEAELGAYSLLALFLPGLLLPLLGLYVLGARRIAGVPARTQSHPRAR